MIYSEKIKVKYSEVNANGILTPTALVNYFQDITMFHSNEVANTVDILEKKDWGWVLSAWQIDVYKKVKAFDEVLLCTSPYDFKGGLGLRNCWLQNSANEIIAVANSFWTFIDTNKMVPRKIMPEIIASYEPLCEKIEMEYFPRKINVPDIVEKRPSLDVKYTQLDTNHHVNNCQYIAMAYEVLGLNSVPGRIRAEYKKPAVFGNVIHPYVGRDNGAYVVDLRDDKGLSYAVVSFDEKIPEKG